MNSRWWCLGCGLFFIAALILFFSARKINTDKLDTLMCRAKYDVVNGDSYLNSVFTISALNGKGSISMIGDYYANGEQKLPVKFYANFTSKRTHQTYVIDIQSTLFSPETLASDTMFKSMLNLFVFKAKTQAVYQIQPQKNGNYIVLIGGDPVFTCSSTK